MTRHDAPPVFGVPRRYFDDMYSGSDDPWGFDSAWYEQRKYAITMAALPHERYRRALEPGCANGALTMLLAGRCDSVVAHDFVPKVVEEARRRTRDLDHVAVVDAEFPDFWPSGTGDLVVWSEVAYYLNDLGAETALAGLQRWLDVDGVLVAVHYTGETNSPRRGREIGPWLDDVEWLVRRVAHVDDDFELGVWVRAAGPTDDAPSMCRPG